jgi:hypothetical protein
MTILVQPPPQPRLIASVLLPIMERQVNTLGTQESTTCEVQATLKAIKQENAILMRCRQEDRDGETVLVSQEQAGQRRGVEKVGPDEHHMAFHVICEAEDQGWTHIITHDEWIYFYKLVDRDEVSALNE